MAAIIFIVIGMLKPRQAYKALNLPVLIFIGSMISLSQILDSTGALSTFVSFVMPWIQKFPTYYDYLEYYSCNGFDR